MLPSAQHVREVYLGSEGILRAEGVTLLACTSQAYACSYAVISAAAVSTTHGAMHLLTWAISPRAAKLPRQHVTKRSLYVRCQRTPHNSSQSHGVSITVTCAHCLLWSYVPRRIL